MSNVDKAGGDNRAGRILRASAAVMLAHCILKIVSPLQYIFIFHVCDEVTRDLFVFAFEGVLGMLFLIGEESLGPAFLPVFMERLDKEDETSAWRFANTVLILQFLLIAGAVGLVCAMPERVVRLLTDWDQLPAADAVRYRELAPEYAKYLVLGLFGMSLGSTTYVMLNGYKRFFLAAFGDAALKLGIVVVLAASWAWGVNVNAREGVWVFAGGVWLGSALKLGSHLLGLRDKLGRFRAGFAWRGPALRKFALLLAPLLLGILLAKVRDIYINIDSLSALGKGVMSAANGGRKIYQTFAYVVPYAISIAMLPFLCEMVDRDEKERMGKLVTEASRLLVLLLAPLAALLVALSLPLARLLFQHGQCDYESCINAAVSNACVSLMLPFMALENIFMQVFFANRRTIFVTVIGLFFSLLGIAITYVCLGRLHMRGAEAVAAAALSFTVSRCLKTLTLGLYMRHFIPVFPPRATLAFLLRAALVAAGAGLCAWWLRYGYELAVAVPRVPPQGKGFVYLALRLAPELALAGLGGAAAGLGLAAALCRSELSLVKHWTLEKLRRRGLFGAGGK